MKARIQWFERLLTFSRDPDRDARTGAIEEMSGDFGRDVHSALSPRTAITLKVSRAVCRRM